MKKVMSMIVAVCVVVSLAGCDAVQRKFTRKSKTKKMPKIYQLKKYDIKPTPELYHKHYAYWESWQTELIQELGQNHKKDKRCIEEILMQVTAMQNMLVKEKADELGKHVKRLEDVRDTIVQERIDQNNRAATLMVLDREDRYIRSGFCVTKIKNYLKESFDEEPPAEDAQEAAPAAAAQEEK
jgi:hypothetical protein